ncbi:hypothetical protein ACV3D6_005077 [Escherichia coli]|uniref:hypothetical protein n=1 Tax=Escherichia coli TaxID=562 RepID=UPI00399A7FC0
MFKTIIFLLPYVFVRLALKPHEDILEREALRTGQTKTAIMKAALAAYEHGLDENGKNHWILQSARLK